MQLSGENLSLEARALLTRITINGKLRKSPPVDGVAKYVWRMVSFSLSSDPRLWCMPTTADFGIDNDTPPDADGDGKATHRPGTE